MSNALLHRFFQERAGVRSVLQDELLRTLHANWAETSTRDLIRTQTNACRLPMNRLSKTVTR